MTPLLVAVALLILTAALLLEERSWQRTLRKRAARPVPQVRCLVCEGAPMVDDFRTHSRLAHGARAVGVEDRAEWVA